jgi:DNA-binding transcriptional LysR family regulator
MPKQLPPLSWFRAFEASARSLSFTLAARELNVTQSAISQHVRALETRLGTNLFERKPRGLALTATGRQLLPYASSAIDGLTKATEIFQPNTYATEISISCTMSFAQLWLTPRLIEFRQLNPQIAINLSSTLWPDDYLINKTDIEIHFGRINQIKTGATVLFPVELAPVCSPSLCPDLNNYDELWKLPLIETLGAMYSWKQWAERMGQPSPPRPVCSVDSLIMAQSLAETGMGVALLSPRLCHHALAMGRLINLQVEPSPAEDCFYFTTSDHAASKAGVKEFSNWLKELSPWGTH